MRLRSRCQLAMAVTAPVESAPDQHQRPPPSSEIGRDALLHPRRPQKAEADADREQRDRRAEPEGQHGERARPSGRAESIAFSSAA